MQSNKSVWNDHYQTIGEFVMTRKQQFTTTITPGEFLNRELFDSTGPSANMSSSSILLGMLWPNGAESFRFVAPKGVDNTLAEVKEYFEKITETQTDIMDNPKARLGVALGEYMPDQTGFGTSGVAIFEQDILGEPPIRYEAWDVKTMYLDEGPDGSIDTIYNYKSMTIRSLVKEYGIENISATSRDAFTKGDAERKVDVLHAIETRIDRERTKFGNKAMPIASIHIEFNDEKILRESGFEEMPVAVARFFKAMKEVYGRSFAMNALPDIIEANVIKEAITIAIEKQMDPPLAVLDDGRLGGGVIDTSAGALNVFNPSGRISSADKMIFPVFTVGELKSAQQLLIDIQNSIMNAFFLDRLLDLNNETRMTLGEAQIRNKIRGDSLGPIFSRQTTELFTPLINRTFNILLKQGLMGVVAGSPEELVLLEQGIEPMYIPDIIVQRMVEGKEAYTIQYISPAARVLKSEEVTGILSTFDFALQNVSIKADMIDNIDADEAIKMYAELVGAPTKLLKIKEQVEAIRDSRNQIAEEREQLDNAREQSEIVRNIGQGQASIQGQNSK